MKNRLKTVGLSDSSEFEQHAHRHRVGGLEIRQIDDQLPKSTTMARHEVLRPLNNCSGTGAVDDWSAGAEVDGVGTGFSFERSCESPHMGTIGFIAAENEEVWRDGVQIPAQGVRLCGLEAFGAPSGGIA